MSAVKKSGKAVQASAASATRRGGKNSGKIKVHGLLSLVRVPLCGRGNFWIKPKRHPLRGWPCVH